MNLFEDIKKKKRLMSVDIETSGTDAAVHDIWAIGAVEPNGKVTEKLFNPRTDQPADFKQKLMSIEGLSKKQNEAKVFDKYFAGLDRGIWEQQDDIAKNLPGLFGNDSALLIQNARFENKFLSRELLNNPEVGIPFRDNMMYKSTDIADYFYVPPEVQKQRALASQAYDKFLDGSNEAFGTVTDKYKALMQAYSDAASHKGIMVIDLMDVSKATYAMAANRGLIDKKFIGVGLGVEFLAKHILNEPEIHGAVADADQQLRIFAKMSTMFDELESGNISGETKDIFKKINTAHPRERIEQMYRAIKSAQEEAGRAGGYRKLDYKEIYRAAVVHGPNGPEDINIYGSPIKVNAENRVSIFTKDPKEAGLHAIQRYRRLGVDEASLVRAQRLVESGGPINHLLNDPGLSENIEVVGTIAKERVKAVKNRAVEWFGELSTKNKMVAVGTAILGTGFILTDSSDSKQKIEELKKKEQQIKSRMYTDSTLKMYTNIPHHHGSGFADWNERTKHHEY